MASVCMDGSMLSEEDELGIDSLERLVDERLAAITNKCIPSYISLLKNWQGTLTRAEEWFRSQCEEFNQLADSLSTKHMSSKEAVLHDHTYSRRRSFVPHNCDKGCWNKTSVSNWQDYSPLSLPLQLDWQRVVSQRLDGRQDVFYIAPCGRRLRSIEEVQLFLNATGMSTMEITQFTFDPQCSVHTLRPYVKNAPVYLPDISEGRERRPVVCINSLNAEYPDQFEYMTARTHESNVRIATEPEFLVCCSCTDNCTNRSQCECWQLTIQEACAIGETQHSVGYFHHRLRRSQLSAIYECNPWCKCGPQCANRVVQNGLQHRLQVFRTNTRGWGLRTLDDIPKGSFVCTYIGHVYTEQGGEEHAIHYGDEYFADLDYIEVMEHHKEGYESDPEAMSVCSSSSSEQGSTYSIESASSMRVHLKKLPSVSHPTETDIMASLPSSTVTTPKSTSPTTSTSPLTSKPASFSDSGSTHSTIPPPFSPRPSPMKQHGMRTRRFFNEDYSYIMDAKGRGNLGRYINHSCSPNMFVQNVFIDTHDLRFPWVAFFAKRRIKALQELTWDYNYDAGSVEGKNIQCLCGAPNCRGRLL